MLAGLCIGALMDCMVIITGNNITLYTYYSKSCVGS